MLRFLLFVAAFSATPTLSAAAPDGQRIRLSQVIDAIDASPRDAGAREKLETYVRAAIEGAIAAGRRSGHPVICAAPGKGRFDALAFRRYALKQSPTRAEQKNVAATPVLIDFVSGENSCG